jgi:tellurite resistance protein TerA
VGIDYNKRPRPGAPETPPSSGGIDYSKRRPAPEPTPPAPPAAQPPASAPPSYEKAPAAATPPSYEKAPAATPPSYEKAPAAAAPAPPAGPVSLTKRGQQVSLTKGGGAIRINLNWNQQAGASSGGLFRKQQGGGIDLDIGCLIELSDGRTTAVQALGSMMGALDRAPWIKLDKDDRSGSVSDGENLFISGDHAAQIKRVAVFAFIYEGTPNWSTAGAVVTIHQPQGEPITIALDETRDGARMCAICIIEGGPSGYTVRREVQYVSGHRELDSLYNWGLEWTRGSK